MWRSATGWHFKSWEFARLFRPEVITASPCSIFPVSLGTYKFPSHPEEPIVLFMLRTPCKRGLPRREQYRMGRYELIGTSFSTFERNIRDQLQRMLSTGGFDASRDIAAITVNRWAHGYAYEYDTLSDPEWATDERPCVVGRKQFGRISIANSDAERQSLYQRRHRSGLSRGPGATKLTCAPRPGGAFRRGSD